MMGRIDDRSVDVMASVYEDSQSLDFIFAIGDIHGRLDLVLAMEDSIKRDASNLNIDRYAICYLGDYIDRGPESSSVLEHLSSFREDGVQRIFLKGNHEDRLLRFMESPVDFGPSWLKYGGRETFASYGIATAQAPRIEDWAYLRDALDREMPYAQKVFLQSLRLSLVWRNYIFVHAGINPNRPLSNQVAEDLLSIREPFLSSYNADQFTVVHGHTISMSPSISRYRIGIDTGAYESNILTCVRLSGGYERIIQVHIEI